MNDEREISGPAIRSKSLSRSSERVREVFAFILPVYYLGRIRSRGWPPLGYSMIRLRVPTITVSVTSSGGAGSITRRPISTVMRRLTPIGKPALASHFPLKRRNGIGASLAQSNSGVGAARQPPTLSRQINILTNSLLADLHDVDLSCSRNSPVVRLKGGSRWGRATSCTFRTALSVHRNCAHIGQGSCRCLYETLV
jgi:hypothetical protein